MTIIEPSQEDPSEEESSNEKNIKKLREQAEASSGFQRELAMVKAGIDTESALGKFFSESYKGELTKDAVSKAAQEIGLLEVKTSNPVVTDDEKTSTQARQNLNSGAADPADLPTKHPREEGLAEARRVLDEGGTFEQGGAAYLSTLMKRHAEGDVRATHQKEEGSSGTQRV